MPFTPGDPVHVASLGKATVREVRNRGRYLVELKGRTVLVAEHQLEPAEGPKRDRRAAGSGGADSDAPAVPVRAGVPASVDLHGMTQEEAVAAVDAFLNDAILAGHDEVVIIHGRSGGRVKMAVHARLRQLPPVRAFRVDARNSGVTLVRL